jgi:uncharacterized membrane protein
MIDRLLNFLTIELAVIFTAALPIIELRGAIPVGISLGLSPIHATILSLIGSMIPVPFILFAVRPVFNYLKTTRTFNKLIHKITHHSLEGNGKKVQKYGVIGLIIVVAIPLPGTGVWSGSLAAALFDIRFKWAFPAIFIGNIIAAFAVMTISSGAFRIFGG